jgi:WD40 repeat protein
MARVCRRSESGIMRWITAIPLLSLLLVTHGSPAAAQALYNQPILVVDPDTHTGRIKSVAINDKENIAVTGSFDKTVRIWSPASGDLLKTIRMPAGPGYIGRVYAIAITTKGDLVAIGGCTSGINDPESVYLFDPHTLAIVKRIGNIADVVSKLAFSPDGRFLAAAAGTTGLRVYDREKQWSEVEAFNDPNYGQKFIYGLSFATDGRLATASTDRKIRLYGAGPEFKLLVPPKDAPAEPFEIAFRPDGGDVLAVGYSSPTVDLLDGHDLHELPGPDVRGLDSKLAVVAWSQDGSMLLVGGGSRVFVWDDGGRGQRRDLIAGRDTVTSLATSADGGILVGGAGPLLKYMESDGKLRWEKTAAVARIGTEGGHLSVSSDGSVVDFGYENGHAKIRFDMKDLTRTLGPAADGVTAPPKRDGLPVGRDNGSLIFRGKKVELETAEEVRALAISPDSKRFVFGTTWTLRGRDDSNQSIWHREMGDVWAVNITGDNRYVVAAYDDGTIRWHQLATGDEVVALMLLPMRDKNDYDWVAWTPEGFYFATPGAFRVLQWHTNDFQDERAFGHAVPASSVPGHRRRDVLELVIKNNESPLTLVERLEANKAVQQAAPAKKRPGHRLHVVAIGINYAQWKSLALTYAENDASQFLTRLMETQASTGMYADVLPYPLDSNSAKQSAIIQMLEATALEMHPGDVAIVFFSGHGVMVGEKFYLVPSDMENLTKTGVQTRGVRDDLLRERIATLASKGRVVVLMDACHSGAFPDSETLLPDAERIRDQISWLNTTVLTSSSATELSHEDKAWEEHGAFTKLLLDAFSATSGADADYNGIITVDELIKYLNERLPTLTNQKGVQTLGVARHAPDGDLFVAGF